MERYEIIQSELSSKPKKWLVTGAAGFIGSHIVQTLLGIDQIVVGLDNFATGSRENLINIEVNVGSHKTKNFFMIEGDITNIDDCRKACKGIDVVLHQAALGSVPRSLENPLSTHKTNVDGFFNIILAAKEENVESFIFASSSSVYGDDKNLPKIEERIGKPLSPYALSKRINEQVAEVFSRAYGFKSIGLRYFNVFGPRQDPEGPYAAAIPRWFAALAKGNRPVIFGDGQTSRDFCYVANVVKANILAATTQNPSAFNKIFNVACGEKTTLNELFSMIRSEVAKSNPEAKTIEPIYEPFRIGDIQHSLADISKTQNHLGFYPTHKVFDGLQISSKWYLRNLNILSPRKG